MLVVVVVVVDETVSDRASLASSMEETGCKDINGDCTLLLLLEEEEEEKAKEEEDPAAAWGGIPAFRESDKGFRAVSSCESTRCDFLHRTPNLHMPFR